MNIFIFKIFFVDILCDINNNYKNFKKMKLFFFKYLKDYFNINSTKTVWPSG